MLVLGESKNSSILDRLGIELNHQNNELYPAGSIKSDHIEEGYGSRSQEFTSRFKTYMEASNSKTITRKSGKYKERYHDGIVEGLDSVVSNSIDTFDNINENKRYLTKHKSGFESTLKYSHTLLEESYRKSAYNNFHKKNKGSQNDLLIDSHNLDFFKTFNDKSFLSKSPINKNLNIMNQSNAYQLKRMDYTCRDSNQGTINRIFTDNAMKKKCPNSYEDPDSMAMFEQADEKWHTLNEKVKNKKSVEKKPSQRKIESESVISGKHQTELEETQFSKMNDQVDKLGNLFI